jgi:hypothetical protein
MEFFRMKMKKVNKIASGLLLILFFATGNISAQTESSKTKTDLSLKGQFSAWQNINPNNSFPSHTGGRYIPQFNFEISPAGESLIDFEASVNIYGSMTLDPFDAAEFGGKIKPYRFWARYSTHQLELRAGLQKINFGSASLLRPLMWFDQVDPRDPLKLTDGVWGVLGRYYFLNNANVWLWGLMGNDNRKGWEIIPSNKNIPEFGGRVQMPVPRGEAAFTFHRRTANSRGVSVIDNQLAEIPENRFAFDAKLDLVVGFWVEGAWINKRKNVGIYTNQEMFNAGMDYTFGIGNGLTVIYEQLLASYDEKPFEMNQTLSFSMLNVNYPIGLFDDLSLIFYFDWTNNSAYNFINWQKQFNKITLFVMGYVNPKNYNIPTQGMGENILAGSGVQLMIVFNH